MALLLAAGCSAPPLKQDPRADAAAQRPASATDNVARRSLDYLGTPYRYGGATPQGFDCSGLVQHVYREAAGIALPRDARSISRAGVPVARAALRPGDLVFFNTQRRPFSHVGIYLGDAHFIHAPGRGRVVTIANLRQSYWQQRFDGARRVVHP